jgi:arylsulfatase A-like enzyme
MNKSSYFKVSKISCISLLSLAIIPDLVYSQDSMPNILIIMTDQQAWDALGYSGNKIIKTPNLDRLAREGVLFTQAITPCPLCVPARTSILTGRLIEKNAIRSNSDIRVNDYKYPTYDELLTQKGYVTEYHGKFHAPEHMARIYSNPPKFGMSGSELIERWRPLYIEFLKNNIQERPLQAGELYENTFFKGMVPYKPNPLDRRYRYLPDGIIPEEELIRKLGQDDSHGVLALSSNLTVSSFQAQEAMDAITRLKDKSFIITCSFFYPHSPIVPSEPYASMYKPEDMVPPVSIRDKREDSPYKTSMIDSLYSDPDMIKYMIANYYALVTEIDSWVGKILSLLDKYNLTEKTLVIFVSDHGEMLGAHGMKGKSCFYEESVRVPLILCFPGKIKSNQRIDVPVSTMNIFPTILDYAGLTNIQSDGYSLKGLMEGRPPRYDFAVSEWNKNNRTVPSIMIRTKEWKLMTTNCSDQNNVDVLYNLENDPYELNNLLVNKSESYKYMDTIKMLRGKLIEYLKSVNYPLTDGIVNRKILK